MAQLTDDEWPSEGDKTTHEQQVERDPIAGAKDPHDERRPWPNESDEVNTARPVHSNPKE